MADNLTRKQVLALSRALKRRGRKLPRVGMCAIFRDPAGQRTTEVCHSVIGGKHVYYKTGVVDDYKKVERRRVKFPNDTRYYKPFKPSGHTFFDTVKREVVFTRGRR